MADEVPEAIASNPRNFGTSYAGRARGEYGA
jgi:hypothetical protein